ncbi:MBL fold metallo-hydrolase (plasmid) [Haladaptatus sp. SPP-AMP-3]|uniref:MBL fold metallo-hydrolase n=1 Tax=Haladaptatus sp. SPP-AMP-3 TaxID=3121295 RepID=UPI003C2F76B9
MVHSTWGDWFVRNEVEAADVGGLSIWYLGCNGYILRTAETTLYLDPYFGDGSPPRTIRMIPVPLDPADATMCDAVFVTHEHIDHMHPPSYGPLVEDLGANVYAPGGAFENPAYDGDLRMSDDERTVVSPGDDISVGDLDVHVREANDPDSADPVSYVVEHESGTFFAPGDSRPADAFHDIGEEFDIDLGVLAYGTPGNIYHTEDGETYVTDWYNDGKQVAEAVNALSLERFAPVHWDVWRGVEADPKALRKYLTSYEYPRIFELIRIGDRLAIDRPGVIRPKSIRKHEQT